MLSSIKYGVSVLALNKTCNKSWWMLSNSFSYDDIIPFQNKCKTRSPLCVTTTLCILCTRARVCVCACACVSMCVFVHNFYNLCFEIARTKIICWFACDKDTKNVCMFVIFELLRVRFSFFFASSISLPLTLAHSFFSFNFSFFSLPLTVLCCWCVLLC